MHSLLTPNLNYTYVTDFAWLDMVSAVILRYYDSQRSRSLCLSMTPASNAQMTPFNSISYLLLNHALSFTRESQEKLIQ